MSISLYDVSVTSFLQTLGAVSAFLDKGLAHCTSAGIDPESIVETRLHPDMLPFRFQLVSVAHHSAGAIEGVRAGVFVPPSMDPSLTYAGLQALITDSIAKLKAVTPAEANGFEGKDMVFALGERKMPFTAEGFLLSFSLPNFYFHASTAYDVLRANGVPLGKRYFLGALKLKS